MPAENQINDFKTYGERIYYLDNQRGIYRVNKPLSAKPELNVWYDKDKDLIKDAQEMIIDGHIWLNTPGRIVKLFKGEIEDFELSKLDKNLGSDLEIYTQIDWDYLYVIDKFYGRLLVIDKSGVAVRQFLNDKLKDAESLLVSDDESLAWFNVGGQVWEISLKNIE